MDLPAFDGRVRLCNTLEASPSIVHVDIDDGSLGVVGRWPWRRADLADLIRAIDELGAEIIMVDLLLSEHEKRYYNDPSIGANTDIETDIEIKGEVSEENKVYGDLELADAVRSAGNVIMAVQLDTIAPGRPEPLRDWLLRRWPEKPSWTPEEVIRDSGLTEMPGVRRAVAKEILRLRVRDELLGRFTQTATEMAKRLGCEPGEVEAVLAGVKRSAADEWVAKAFAGGSVPDISQVRAAVLGVHRDRRNADTRDVINAYRRRLGLIELRKALHPLRDGMADHLHRAREAVPLYYEFAGAAEDIAAVRPIKDSDGSVRRVPLVIEYEGRCVLHLGFVAAAHILDLDVDRMTMQGPRALLVPRRGGGDAVEVPLDGQGNMIIPWTRTGKDWRRGGDFPHIPAAKVWSLVDARRQMRANERMIDYHLADLVAASKGQLTIVHGEGGGAQAFSRRADTEFHRKVREQLALKREIHLAELRENLTPEDVEALKQRSREMLAIIRREQALAVSMVELACDDLDAMSPEEIESDAELKERADQYWSARKLLREDIAALRRANHELSETIEKLKGQLGERIGGKYVFLGFAATALGDIVATPIDPETNGVMCHANVLNAFLQNRFISRAPRWVEVGVCLLLGAFVALVTGTRGPRVALLTTLILMAAYTLLNGLQVFKNGHTWLALVAIVFTVFLSWAFVTLFRQLTAERDKRLFRKQLSQYTSPAIAARIAESPKAAEAFKAVQTRDVTCFFSDLKGFTTITEQEDAEVVQHVLNVYLEHMSRVIWSFRGLINKFMGDGIMAFFNPSVDPLADHPRMACDAALAAFERLDALRHEQAGQPGGDVFEKLEMRIGIATGLCMNGDMGSELKADYTVIGDVVNLAARLEPANKVFGTRIMISQAVRDVVKDEYEFRRLADLRVKGKAKTVPVYEVVCRKGELTDEQGAYIGRFEAGAALYRDRKWDECIVHFTRMLSRRPDDVGASRYIDACQEFKTFPPDDDWAAGLELKEK